MIYCISDIHGSYDRYQELLEKIRFCEKDTLYILGDVVDRGPQPMRVLLDMMARPNVIPVMGNHEFMAVCCLRALAKEITPESIASLNANTLTALGLWFEDGGDLTLEDFCRLSSEARKDVLNYLGEFRLYEEVAVSGQEYLLLHAGLGNFSPERPLGDYTLDELLEAHPDYGKVYFPDKIVVTGHTPTALIPENPRPGFIFRGNGHLAIDCGCCFGGRLGAVCLDTGEEFYSEGESAKIVPTAEM